MGAHRRLPTSPHTRAPRHPAETARSPAGAGCGVVTPVSRAVGHTRCRGTLERGEARRGATEAHRAADLTHTRGKQAEVRDRAAGAGRARSCDGVGSAHRRGTRCSCHEAATGSEPTSATDSGATRSSPARRAPCCLIRGQTGARAARFRTALRAGTGYTMQLSHHTQWDRRSRRQRACAAARTWRGWAKAVAKSADASQHVAACTVSGGRTTADDATARSPPSSRHERAPPRIKVKVAHWTAVWHLNGRGPERSRPPRSWRAKRCNSAAVLSPRLTRARRGEAVPARSRSRGTSAWREHA